MLFKPAGRPAAAAPGTTSSHAAADAAQLLYTVAWEAGPTLAEVQLRQQRQPLRAMRHSLRWELGDGSHVRLHASSGAGSFGALQSSLSLLQAACGGRGQPSVALSTQLLMPGMRHSSPAHAAAVGLLKVAAREAPAGQRFAFFTHTAFAATARQLPADVSDMFGVGVAGKSAAQRC